MKEYHVVYMNVAQGGLGSLTVSFEGGLTAERMNWIRAGLMRESGSDAIIILNVIELHEVRRLALDARQRIDSYMLNAQANLDAGDLQKAVSYLEAAAAEITAEIREG